MILRTAVAVTTAAAADFSLIGSIAVWLCSLFFKKDLTDFFARKQEICPIISSKFKTHIVSLSDVSKFFLNFSAVAQQSDKIILGLAIGGEAVTTFYVDEIVHANEEQFDEICRGDDSEILKQYNEKTYDPITDGVHGILVIGPKGDGVMVDTSGYDYARYMSYAPKIEMPVNYILEQNMKRDAIYEMKLYVPLKVTRYDEEFEEEEIDGEPYMRDIRERVREFNREDGERGLAEYYSKDNISRNKVYSIRPDVERVRDVMMGVAVIKMTKPLTEPEIEDLKDYLTGQFADGWGESFEQRAIEVSGREIYVHYWDSHEYYIKTEEEMEQDFEQEQGMQGMGGMSGM